MGVIFWVASHRGKRPIFVKVKKNRINEQQSFGKERKSQVNRFTSSLAATPIFKTFCVNVTHMQKEETVVRKSAYRDMCNHTENFTRG
ncbi:hypothetical protein EDM55_05620 [Brevibacillus centrosporus]|nr:hypothetical protein EDM55_05620 [Brevibacillus centrosporus]